METDFIYWPHPTAAGIKVEEISGGHDKSPKVWKAMAMQVYGENGRDTFRTISHTSSGAPLLDDSQQRISVSHTSHFMVIASLPRTPEANLSEFSPRTAMGIDCERTDRHQVLKVADRVFAPKEMEMLGAPTEQNTQRYILGWTIKEALYKAALTEGLDFRTQLSITQLPAISDSPTQNEGIGKAIIHFGNGAEIEMDLFSYLSEGHIITLAYSPKCATFKKK